MTEDQNRTFTDKFMLRLPDGMRDALKECAAENNRSLNAEIVARLILTLETNNLKAAEDLVSIQELNYYNGTKVLDLLREATARMENLIHNAHLVDDMLELDEKKNATAPPKD